MAQEDEITHSNSDVNRFSKKQRPKKVPQRGLGVAQLEKIRMEEQQKKNSSSILLPSSQSSVATNHHHHHKSAAASASASSAPAPASSCFPLPIPTFIPPNPGNGSVGGNKMWGSCDYEYNNIEKECSGLDPGLAFRSNLSLPYESEPIWPFPCLMQQPFQRPSSSSSTMVNLPSTSLLNFQMEPSSNQTYYGNCAPLLPDDDKVVGMKRSYPFSLDNAPGPPIYTKYPPLVHSINGQVEPTSSSNGSTFNFEPVASNFRVGASCSTSNMESKSKKSIKQNGVFDGDFLTLAPPTTKPMCSSKHPSSILTYYNCELPDLESLPYQASFEDTVVRQGIGGFNQSYRPYYSFLPPAMMRSDRATTMSVTNCKGGEVGHVDLDLKL